MPVAGIKDKRQIKTTVLTVTATGDMLPAQVIHGGKTPTCLPNATFPINQKYKLVYGSHDPSHHTFTTLYINTLIE